MEIENDCKNQEHSSSESDKEDEQIKHIPNKETIIIKTEPSKLTANPIVVAFHDKSFISKMQEEKKSEKVYFTCPDSFKKRERNLVPREKNIFLSICQKHADIHNNSLETICLNRKRKAWEEIHKEFIAACPESSDRTVKFLKGCWKRLKKEASASNASLDGILNNDAEMAFSPASNTIYILDDGAIALASNSSPTHPVPTVATQPDGNSSISNSTPKRSTEKTYLLKVKKPTNTVQDSVTPKKILSNEALQRKALETALEAENEKLEAHKYLKEAQKYAMLAEKERFETELIKKEAARLALKREKSYF